jgi:hypothetical protein
MPIRPEWRHYYRGARWRGIRERILARAGNCCEQCGKPNGVTIETITRRANHLPLAMWWRGLALPWRTHTGELAAPETIDALRRSSDYRLRTIRVKIGVGHLNHLPGDDRDENLRALCDWCHLHHDAGQHKETRSDRKDASRPLLGRAS